MDLISRQTYYELDMNQIFPKTRECFNHLHNFMGHMFLFKRWNSISNWSKLSFPSTKGFGSAP